MNLRAAMITLMGVFIGFSLMSLPAFAETKLGYIDMEKAIQSTKDGKKAKKKLEKEFEKRKKELTKKESDLKKMNVDLEKKALVLSDDVRLKKQQELQREMMKYRETVQKSQREIQQEQQKLTVPIVKKLQKIMAEIGTKDGYTMIFEKREQSIMWAKKGTNLTDRIVKAYNK